MSRDAYSETCHHVCEMPAFKARIAQLEAALKAVEYIPWNPDDYRCPFCRWLRGKGHAPDCIVGKALKPC